MIAVGLSPLAIVDNKKNLKACVCSAWIHERTALYPGEVETL